MKSISRHAAVFLLPLLAYGATVGGQENAAIDHGRELADLRATVQQLHREVALLRRAVTGLELQHHRDIVRQIQLELFDVRAERARESEADQTREQDLHDMEEALNRPDLTAEQRATMEGARNELQILSNDDESGAVRDRVDDLFVRLHAEQEVIKKLEDAWKRLGGGITP